MLVGAQLYSVRNKCGSSAEIKETLAKMKELGYASVQVSGFPYDAEEVRKAADEVGMHIGLTHTDIKAVIGNTDEVIRNHKILGADMVGIGYPGGYIDSEGKIDIKKLYEDISPAVEKINNAGLKFGYHNHAYEFKPNNEGIIPIDWMFKNTNWHFILDTGWMCEAGEDAEKRIAEFASRLYYVHLKDFKKATELNEESHTRISPIGYGDLPMTDVWNWLENVGVKIAYVEQDNAAEKEDAYGEMKKSIDYLISKGLAK